MKNLDRIGNRIPKEKDKALRDKKSKVFKSINKALNYYKEEYKYTPLLKTLEKEFEILDSTSGKELNSDKYSKYLTDNKGYQIVIVNGNFQKKLSTIPKNINVNSFHKLDKKNRVVFDKIYHNSDDSNSDIFSSINSINHEDCLSIMVEKNITVEDNISIINLIDTNNVCHHRKLIYCKKNSKCSFDEVFINIGENKNFSSSVSEIYLEDGANLTYYNQQKIEENFHFNSTNVFQEKNSTTNFFTFSFSGAMIRNNLNIKLKEKNCYANMYGFYALKKKSHIDNHTTVDHMDENSISNEHYKGIMDEGSRGVFNGKIYVRQKAQKTNAFQSNNNILLSDNAKVYTKPQLEIWADDVKCSHGCTVGQLDNDALFYLMSRGIPINKAISLLLLAFSNEIFTKIKDENLKIRFEKIVMKELEKFNDE